MRKLLEVTIGCRAEACEGRVRVRRSHGGGPGLIGVCEHCGTTASCTLPEEDPVRVSASALVGAPA